MSEIVDDHDIARVRSFNRLVTRQVGALNDPYLGRRPLGEARVLFEIGPDGATPRDVRARLGLDSGYLSRMIGSLERDGLVEKRPNPADRRTKRLSLTRAGRSELRALDRVSDRLAASVLDPLTADQRTRLLSAQTEVMHLLAISMASIEPEDPASPDARWCLTHYFADLAERFEERFDPGSTLPADAADLVPPNGVFLIARVNGQPVACGAVKHGELMRMWVDRRTAGSGSARACSMPSSSKRWRSASGPCASTRTDRSPRPRRSYRSRGYQEIPRYNDDPYANHWFEKRLG